MLQLPPALLPAMAMLFRGITQQKSTSPAQQAEKGLTANMLGSGSQHMQAAPWPSELWAG